MTTLSDIKDMTVKLQKHYNSAINIELEVWNFDRDGDDSIKHTWSLYISRHSLREEFETWSQLESWVDSQMNPVEDDIQIEEEQIQREQERERGQ